MTYPNLSLCNSIFFGIMLSGNISGNKSVDCSAVRGEICEETLYNVRNILAFVTSLVMR